MKDINSRTMAPRRLVFVMESSCCYVFVILLCYNYAFASDGGEHHRIRHETSAMNNNVEHQTEIESENKLMLECQHSDYRTYIKCLKREKRQHHGGLEKRACLDECFEIKCNTSACLRDCHARCRRRLIETYSKTVETYDCTDGSCPDSNSGGNGNLQPNITTNIHINNVLPNGTNCNNDNGGSGGPGGHGGSGTSGGSGGRGGPGGHGGNGTGSDGNGWGNGGEPRININNVINNNGPGSSNPDCPCPASGCNCYPFSPWQAMPQITIGFGPGPVGGCSFPGVWPCLQKYPQQQQQTPPIDCSICSNPFLRYQCNPVCTPTDTRLNGTVNTTPRAYPGHSVYPSPPANQTPPPNNWNTGWRRP